MRLEIGATSESHQCQYEVGLEHERGSSPQSPQRLARQPLLTLGTSIWSVEIGGSLCMQIRSRAIMGYRGRLVAERARQARLVLIMEF